MGSADLFESAEPDFSWCPDWRGETVVIIASGPSAKEQPIDRLRGRAKVVTVNTSYQLATWADILYACDYNWWTKNRGAPLFQGLKVSQDRVAHGVFRTKRVHAQRGVDHPVFDQLGYICWASNSGLQALNLIAQFGPRKIILVGFDMTLKAGSHWHGKHPSGMLNPIEDHVDRWRVRAEAFAPILAARGIEVINCSPISTLISFPKMGLMEALER